MRELMHFSRFTNHRIAAARLLSQSISPVQAGGQTTTVTGAEYPSIERGYEYCGRLVLGGSAVTVNLGSLDFATIDSADLGLSDVFGPSLAASVSVSREVPMTVSLFDGGTRSGDTCVGGSLYPPPR